MADSTGGLFVSQHRTVGTRTKLDDRCLVADEQYLRKKMASSSQLTEGITREEREKQVRAWLREIPAKNIRVRLDEMAFVKFHKLMIRQEAAEKDTSEQTIVRKERDKFFTENAENLEAGLRAANIAPDQLPEKSCNIIKRHAHAAVLLGLEDSAPERIRKKFAELIQKHAEVRDRQSKLRAIVQDLKELSTTLKQHLSDANNTEMHMTVTDEERKFRKWEGAVKRYKQKVTKLKEHPPSSRKKLAGMIEVLSLHKQLHNIWLEVQDVEDNLPAAGMPADKDAIRKMVDQKKMELKHSEEALTEYLAEQIAQTY